MPPKVAPTPAGKLSPPKKKAALAKARPRATPPPLQETSHARLFKRPVLLPTVKLAWPESPVKKVSSTGYTRLPDEKEKPQPKLTKESTLQKTIAESKTFVPTSKPQTISFSQASSSLAKFEPRIYNPKPFRLKPLAEQPQLTSKKPETTYLISAAKNQAKSNFSAPLFHPAILNPSAASAAPKAPSTSHLDSLALTNVNGTLQFQTLVKTIQTEQTYWIPYTWPTPIDQRGHCCGLYALEIALKYAYPDRVVPPARKNGNRSLHSLREIAKQRGYSSFGEIYNIAYLKKIAEAFEFKTSTALQLASVPYSLYKNKMCNLLRAGNSLLVSCDLGGTNESPGKAKGLHAHWALIFGFFHCNDECHFLVTQYGKYYLWSAKKLYESNFHLPWGNPRSGPFYFYQKNKETKEENYLKVEKALSAEILSSARYCKDQNLLNFQFTILTTPTPALSKSICLEAQAAKEQTAHQVSQINSDEERNHRGLNTHVKF